MDIHKALSPANTTPTMKGIKTERNSSIELLRLLLMFMIVIHHCIVHGLSLTGISDLWKEPTIIKEEDMALSMIINALCICSVNVFVLISGYFGIRISKKKIANFLFLIFFYSITSALICYFFVDHHLSSLLRGCLAISNSPYWFIRNYLILMGFSPLLNKLFTDYNKSQIRGFIVMLLFVSCYLGFVFQNATNPNGYTLFQFIMMYCIGRYIREYKITMKASTSFLCYFLSCLICGGITYLLYYKGHGNRAWAMTFYNNPLVILSACFLFLGFQSLHFHSKIINKFSKSAIAVYLLQSSVTGEYYLYNYISDIYNKIGGGQNLALNRHYIPYNRYCIHTVQ